MLILVIEFYQVYELQRGLRNRTMFLNTAKGLLIERRDSGLDQQTKSLIKFALKRCFSRDY